MSTHPNPDAPEVISVLLVEDEGSYRQVMAMRLRAAGEFHVTECDSGNEAIALLGSRQFDVVVLDHKMPDVSGLNVLQHIHEQKWDIATIMLTAAGSENLATEAMKLGAYDYIPKHQLDLQHLPLVVRGVHERHLFRKEKEQRLLVERDRTKHVASLERLKSAVESFEHVANTTLSVMSLTLDECEHELTPLMREEGQPHLERAIRLMKEDHLLLSLVVKSLTEISSVMYEKFEQTPPSSDLQEDLDRQLKAIQERIATHRADDGA